MILCLLYGIYIDSVLFLQQSSSMFLHIITFPCFSSVFCLNKMASSAYVYYLKGSIDCGFVLLIMFKGLQIKRLHQGMHLFVNLACHSFQVKVLEIVTLQSSKNWQQSFVSWASLWPAREWTRVPFLWGCLWDNLSSDHLERGPLGKDDKMRNHIWKTC